MLDVNSVCCRLWNWFSAVDTDRSGEISAPELGTLSLSFFLLYMEG